MLLIGGLCRIYLTLGNVEALSALAVLTNASFDDIRIAGVIATIVDKASIFAGFGVDARLVSCLIKSRKLS